MSKNDTNVRSEDYVKLATELSEYINILAIRPTPESIAGALNIEPNQLVFTDNGDLKLEATQVKNLSGKEWLSIKELAQGIESMWFDQFVENKGYILDEIEKYRVSDRTLEESYEPEALDNFFQFSSDIQFDSFEKSLSNDLVSDPITEAIRTEILAKQRSVIVDFLRKTDPTISETVKDIKEYSEFLKDEENKRKVDIALKDLQVKSELEQLEIAGYKKVHKDFEKSFSPILWDGSSISNVDSNTVVRTQGVKNAEGLDIAELKETTNNLTSVLNIKNSKGENIEIKSYRTIDFPIELESKSGPMHLSMAVKDQNGKNIALSKAVYFTAHYDENGKLTEVSSPKPVMFSSTDPDAIGYIEHQGQIYTLPVTQRQYREMMQYLGRDEELAISSLAEDIMISDLNLRKVEKSSVPRKDSIHSKSYLEEQSDLLMNQEKKHSLKEFEQSKDKEKFLLDILDSDLNISNKMQCLKDLSNNGYGKEVTNALISSKMSNLDKTDLVRSLFRDSGNSIELVEMLGGSSVGRDLIIKAFELGDSKERYDISNAIAESSVVQKTDLTKRVILAIEGSGKEGVIDNISKNSRDGENLVNNLNDTVADVNLQNALEKSEINKNTKRVDDFYIKADNLREKLSKPIATNISTKRSEKEIFDIANILTDSLDGKSLAEQKILIEKKLEEFSKGEKPLSNTEKIKFLNKINENEATKRGNRLAEIQEGKTNVTIDDKHVSLQSNERQKDEHGFPTEIVSKFVNKKEIVNKAGNIALQSYILAKINSIASQNQNKQHKESPLSKGGGKSR